MIDFELPLVRSDRVLSAPLGEGTAILDMASEEYVVLSGVAAAIWERLSDPVSPSALCAALGEIYDVPAEQCRREVLGFLEQAHAKGLIRQAAG